MFYFSLNKAIDDKLKSLLISEIREWSSSYPTDFILCGLTLFYIRFITDNSGLIGSKTTDECGDEWRRVHTSGYRTGDEYIRVPRGQETSTNECLEVRRRVHTTGDEYIEVRRRLHTTGDECLEVRRRVHTTGDEYIRVPRGQETSTYDRRRVHMSA